MVTDDEVVLPTFDVVLGYVEEAIEWGLRSPGARSYLDRMGFDVDAYDPLTHDIDGHGSVDTATAHALRLEWADALERVVDRAGVASGRR